MTKSRKSRVLISVLVFVVLVGALQLGTGVFDFIPRLRAQATSPDGALTVKIYQKRLMPGPLFPRMGAVAKVFDSSGHLVHEDLFFRDGDFDNTLHDAFKQIAFEGEEIVIGPGSTTEASVTLFGGRTGRVTGALFPPSNKSLDASGGSVFRIKAGAAKVE